MAIYTLSYLISDKQTYSVACEIHVYLINTRSYNMEMFSVCVTISVFYLSTEVLCDV